MSHDHNKEFDGIKQADNLLPTWYSVSFVATMVIGVLYLLYYHVLTDFSQEEMYKADVAYHAELYPAVVGLDDLAGNPFYGDAEAIAAGAKHYSTVCAACHLAEGTGLIGRDRLVDDAGPFILGAPLGPEATIDIDRLRPQSNMPHDRNAALDHVGDLGGGIGATFNLHRLTAGFLHDPGGIQEGLIRIRFI